MECRRPHNAAKPTFLRPDSSVHLASRNQLAKKVADIETEKLARRTEMSIARHNLLQDVKKGNVEAWM